MRGWYVRLKILEETIWTNFCRSRSIKDRINRDCKHYRDLLLEHCASRNAKVEEDEFVPRIK